MSQALANLKKDPKSLSRQDKQDIIIEYTPLIRFIAQRIASKLPPNVDLDDLISSGVIGLMDAIDKYDPTRDNQFKTYAEFRIRGSILDELRAQDWVPRSVREKSKILEKAYRRLEQKHGRKVTKLEVAKSLKMNLDDFHELLSCVKSTSVVSLEDLSQFPYRDRNGILGFLEDMRANNPHFQMTLKDLQALVRHALEMLAESERMVLALYYYEDMNLKEIGSVLDVTESRISQIHSQAVQRLRASVKKMIESDL
ncbi:MAG: FliA/WhiG family RNA polymerase sigma factor [Deltaproteobacteria bacterium]|nr:FliA/WhiG family RNA polymerase sigma factor [Deltaproteobacteria bacterium]